MYYTSNFLMSHQQTEERKCVCASSSNGKLRNLIFQVLGDSPELNNFKEAMVQSFMLKCRSKESPNQEETIDTMEYVRRLKAVVVLQRAYRDYK